MDTKLTLWGISDELEALDKLSEMDSGEITEEFEQLQDEAMHLLQLKVDSTVGYLQMEENNIAAAKEKISEFKAFIKTKENKIKFYHDFIKSCLDRTGKTSFDGEFKQLKLRKPLDVLKTIDAKKAPLKYLTVIKTTKIDNAQIKKDIKAGEKVDGYELIKGEPGLIVGLKKGKK